MAVSAAVIVAMLFNGAVLTALSAHGAYALQHSGIRSSLSGAASAFAGAYAGAYIIIR